MDDPVLVARAEEEMVRKYEGFRSPRAGMSDATRRHYEQPFVFLRIVPEDRFISWDNRKLARDR